MASTSSNEKMVESIKSDPTVEAIRSELSSKLSKTLAKGDTWYLIDTRWFKQLKKYLGLDLESGTASEGDASVHPGPIDNSPLFDPESEEAGELREHLLDELDFVLLPEEAWALLVANFSLTPGQEPIARKVVEHGMFVKHCKVEVYYVELKLIENSNHEKVIKKKFSKSDTIAMIESKMREIFDIESSVETRLWNKYTSNTYEQLAKPDLNIQDAGLYSGQVLLIEQKLPNGTWARNARCTNSALANTPLAEIPISTPTTPTTTSESTSNGSTSTGAIEKTNNDRNIPTPPTPASTSSMSTRYNFGSHSDGGAMSEKAKPGICGLSNLGNTCFMNSIIQGLSNTPPIMEYFANDNYIEDINEENPLGMKGEIARTFGELVKSMWSGRYTFVVPRNFKQAVGRFAPQFSGYQQQDSQELLTFLLDGLHEDLNRIKQKPYIELKDSENRADEDVAIEAWEVYKTRNDSVILDLFHGLLKSTVVCPECNKISVTFDPFCYLSLPLPVRKERQIELFFVFMDPKKCPTQYKVTVPKNGNMSDLCSALSKLSGVDSGKMVVTDVYNHRFHKIYSQEEALQQILERDDIFVFEVPTTDPENSEIVLVPVYLRERKSSASYAPSNLFGQPLMVGIPRNGTDYEKLYEVVLAHLSRFVTPPKEGEEWWKTRNVNGETSSNAVNGVENGEDSPTDDTVNKSPSSEADETMGEEEQEDEDDGKGPPKLFTMNFVNSYGNAQLEQLSNDLKPIKFTGKNYISLDWHPKAKELFYSEKSAEDFAQDDSYHAKVTAKKQCVRLDECLELYTSKEKLGENDAWYCPQCKKHQQASKKFDLWSLPSILVISLKRFSYNRYWRDKLDTLVEFPTQNLDMAPYVINTNHGPAVYDLIAVSNHYGGMGGGHYTAYAKNQNDNHWYHFDDASVSSISEEGVVTKAAYVLFYQRREPNSGQMCNGAAKMNGGHEDDDELMDTN